MIVSEKTFFTGAPTAGYFFICRVFYFGNTAKKHKITGKTANFQEKHVILHETFKIYFNGAAAVGSFFHRINLC